MRLALLVCCVFIPYLAAAQVGQRPNLSRNADQNDWEAYYDLGVEELPHDIRVSEAAFAWASRLRPDRAEPLYGQWIAFWARDIDRFGKYLRDDETTLRNPDVIRIEAIRQRALRRSPFVHQGLILFLYDRLPGRFSDDGLTRGWISLGQAELPQALATFGNLIRRDPRQYGYLRFVRASAFVNTRRPDSAEPMYATPYFLLASALDDSRDRAAASDTYKQFLSHAAQSDTRRSEAQRKIQTLSSSP